MLEAMSCDQEAEREVREARGDGIGPARQAGRVSQDGVLPAQLRGGEAGRRLAHVQQALKPAKAAASSEEPSSPVVVVASTGFLTEVVGILDNPVRRQYCPTCCSRHRDTCLLWYLEDLQSPGSVPLMT